MSAQRPAPIQPQVPQMLPLTPEVLAQLVANQTKELEIRLNQTVATERKEEREYVFAHKQLEAQERDRKDERRNDAQRFTYSLYAAVSIVVVICVFFGYCINQGNSEIVTELIKLLCYGGPAGVGGFAWGRYKGKPESENK